MYTTHITQDLSTQHLHHLLFFSQDSDGLSWSISVTLILWPSCPTENKHQQTAQFLNVGDCGLSSTSRLCCQVMDELLFRRTMKIELIKTFDQHQSIKQTLSQKFKHQVPMIQTHRRWNKLCCQVWMWFRQEALLARCWMACDTDWWVIIFLEICHRRTTYLREL